MNRDRRGHEPVRARLDRRTRAALAATALGTALLFVAPVLFAPAAASAAGAPGHRSSVGGLRVVSTAPEPGRLAGTTRLGAMSSAQVLTGSVALKPRNETALAAFIERVSSPSSASYRDYLAKGQFASTFGPSPATVAAVERTLRGDSLSVTGVTSDGLLVRFSGHASTIESAFHTGIDRYRLANGAIGYATTSAVRVPAGIAPAVAGVVGLDDLVQLRPEGLTAPRSLAQAKHTRTAISRSSAGNAPETAAAAGAPKACGAAVGQEQFGGITDTQVAHSYGIDGLYAAGDLGKGETVDIFELEPYLKSDIATFDKCYFGADHTKQVKSVLVDGGPGTGEGSGEAALDIENISAIAPDADINVYLAPNSTTGSLDDYDSMVVADNARAISTSWGLCEGAMQVGAPGTLQIENSIFMEAAAQGESIFAAAGDSGSDDCAFGAQPTPQYLSVDDPGSDPYVVSAGGTTFLNTAEPPDETVWDDGDDWGAGGGGISSTWQMPAWQESSGAPGTTSNAFITKPAYQFCSNDPTGVADDGNAAGEPTTLASGTLCREVPDVTALADEYTGITIYDAGWTTIGGTSSSAPLWAAMDAEMSASKYCSASKVGVGFLSPLLYRVAGDPTTYKEAFNDIKVGDNDSLDVGSDLPGGDGKTYPAGTGYDLASGLGSPRITNPNGEPGLAELACGDATSAARPAITASLSPAFGPASGGTSVTITGAHFGDSTGSVSFGDTRVPAQDITSWTCSTATDCTIVVASPKFYEAEGTGGPAGGVALVTVMAAGTPSLSSAPSAVSTFHYLSSSPTDAPVVDYVSPAEGTSAGGTKVVVLGSGFETGGGVSSVTFGGAAATSVKVLSDSELTAVTPAGGSSCVVGSGLVTTGACQTQVVVTTGSGPSPTSTILTAYQGAFAFGPSGVFVPPANCACEVVPAMTEYDYAPQPKITSISPRYGTAYGGTVETIDGTGFNLLTYEWTDFGNPASSYNQDVDLVSISADSLQVVEFGANSLGKPGSAPMPSTVYVQSFGGLGANGSKSPFAFASVPELTSLSSSYGSTGGGQRLTIHGSGFVDATSVKFVTFFGALAGVAVVYLANPPASNTSITINTPAEVPTGTDVRVCSATGCSPDNAADVYVYDYPGRPVVDKSSPTSGAAHGGTRVTIVGSLLTGVRQVYFGNTPAEGFSNGVDDQPSGDSTVITAIAPPGAAGSKVDLKVLTYGSSSPTATGTHATFTYSKSTPSAPTSVSAAPGGGSATVRWRAPPSDGGYPLKGFTVVASSPGRKSVIAAGIAPSSVDYTFAYLQPGVPWSFNVSASTSIGAGPAASAGKAVRPIPGDNGYLIGTSDGAVFGFGSLASAGGVGGGKLTSPIVGIASTEDGLGYYEVAADGTVYRFGDAQLHGSVSLPAGKKVVSIASTPDGAGYWLVTADGAVYAFGDARYHGGVSKVTDVVAITPSRDGKGYLVVEADGVVHPFGDARFHGDLAGKHITKPIVGAETDPATGGYWLVGGDGGIFSFDAHYYGSMIGKHLNEGATGMVSTPDGHGYWIVAADGGVFTFGSAHYAGNTAGTAQSSSIGIASGRA